MRRRDLRPLFEPASVAVVGASNDPLKWGYGLARGALRGRERRPVHLVNRNGGVVLGERAHRSLAELPGPVELVVVAVPQPAFEETVEAALAAGARAIVGITAGLGESGAEGRARELAIVERVRAAGAVLLGPNCLGVFDAGADLDIGWSELPGGPIGLVSQSGNLALELALRAAEVGLGFSRFASLGNQADLEAAELVHALAEHEPTRVIALYVEDFRDGRAFAEACRAAVAGGTPVALLAAGRSSAAAVAARSHTGALASDHAAVEAACRACGAALVCTPRELLDAAQALLARVRPRGGRVVVFGDGGGHGVVAADVVAAAGLELPRLSEATAATIAAALGPTAATRNPVDLAGGGEQDLWSFERVARIVLASGEADAALLTGYFGGYAEYGHEYEERERAVAIAIARAAAEHGCALAVQTMYPAGPAATALRGEGVPVYGAIEGAAAALALLAPRPRPAAAVPPLPAPDPPLAGDGYFDVRAVLAAGGVPFVEARLAASAGEAVAAADAIGYPVVVKALGLLHKSDAGGVTVGLARAADVARAAASMIERLAPAALSVERMAPLAGGVELIVGARWDVRFGPIVLAGAGGVHTELLRDVAVGLAPVDEQEAEALVRSLRSAPLLTGWRGRPALDVPAAARSLAALSRVAAAHPELAEVEVNPLLVTADGALGLDARAVLRREGGQDAR
jgi:acyl-CoA synthetase (NDP forming)